KIELAYKKRLYNLLKGLNDHTCTLIFEEKSELFHKSEHITHCVKYIDYACKKTIWKSYYSFNDIITVYANFITFCVDYEYNGSLIRYGHCFSKQEDGTFKSSPLSGNNKTEIFLLNPNNKYFEITILLSLSDSGVTYDQTIVKN